MIKTGQTGLFLLYLLLINLINILLDFTLNDSSNNYKFILIPNLT